MSSTKDAGRPACGKIELPPRTELILGGIGLALILGWTVHWAQNGFGLFESAYPVLSFFGSAVLVLWIAIKPFRLFSLPAHVDQKILPIVSLLPVLGYLVHVLSRPYEFLTIGGSVALAYFSAITYWRKQFLEIASAQVGSTKSAPSEKSKVAEASKESVAAEKTPASKEKTEGPQKKAEPAKATAGSSGKKKRKRTRKGKKGSRSKSTA